MYYKVPLEVSHQEDGLWRATALHLKGCWVDAPTLAEALAQISDVIAMVLDLYNERGWPVPEEVQSMDKPSFTMSLPVATSLIST